MFGGGKGVVFCVFLFFSQPSSKLRNAVIRLIAAPPRQELHGPGTANQRGRKTLLPATTNKRRVSYRYRTRSSTSTLRKMHERPSMYSRRYGQKPADGNRPEEPRHGVVGIGEGGTLRSKLSHWRGSSTRELPNVIAIQSVFLKNIQVGYFWAKGRIELPTRGG